jgi:hypothetical protein
LQPHLERRLVLRVVRCIAAAAAGCTWAQHAL